MVRVPSAVEAGLGAVAPNDLVTPRQSVSVPSGAFGADRARANVEVGQQVLATAGDVAIAARQVKVNEDNARVKDAETQFNTYLRSRMFLDDDAYMAQRGLNAMQSYEQFETDLRKQRDALMEGLDNGVQRDAFYDRSERKLDGKLTTAQRHRNQERDTYELGQFNAILEDAVEDAGLDWSNENVADNLVRGRAELTAAAEKYGWSADELRERRETFESALYANVIGTMLETDPQRARELYNRPAVQAKIEPDQRAVIEKNLKTQENKREIFRRTDEIMVKHAGDEKAALREAAKIDDPDIREGVENQVVVNFGRQEAIEKEAQRQADQDGWAHVLNGQPFLTLPASTLNAMSPAARTSVEAWSQAKANGEMIKTDWRTYDRLLEMSTDNQQRFLDVDLPETHRHLLADTELKQLVNLQTAIREGRLPDPASPAATLTQQMNFAIDRMGLTGENNVEKRGMFKNAVTREVSRAEAAKGTDLTYEEQQGIIDSMMLTVESDPDWSMLDRSTWGEQTADISGQLFEIDVEGLSAAQRETFIVPLDTMPAWFERSIASRLAKYGIPNPSDHLIERTAGLFVLGDQQGLQALITAEKQNAAAAP